MSFRIKTILGIAGIEAVVLLILVVSSLQSLRASNEDELTKRTYTIAKIFASTTKDAVLVTNLAGLKSFVDEVMTNADLRYARVKDRDGLVLAQSGDEAVLQRKFVPDTKFDGVTDGIYDAYADIVAGGERYGRVEIGVSSVRLNELLAAARQKLLFIAATEMILVGLFSFALGVYLTRGLDALKEASQRLARGELGYQIPVRGRDELAQTAQAFNSMSRQLLLSDKQRAEAEAALGRLNADLERHVSSRTKELAAANLELEHRALHDGLTQLPNRSLLLDRLHQAMLQGRRYKKSLALVILDMDRFKEINDTLGHQTGDLVLQEVAFRAKSCLRQSDTVARLGGDEFALLLPSIGDAAAATQVMQKLVTAIERPMSIGGRTIDIGASLGAALFPQDGDDVDTLMRRADLAMYSAKRTRSGFAIYAADLETVGTEKLALQNQLHRAIDADQLLLHYQPKIDLHTNAIVGVEALLRWQHPQHGLMFPDAFLPAAERTGLMRALTEWVLEAALRQRARWYDQGLPLQMSVNISAANLQDREFPDQVAAILQRNNADGSILELEVTETAVMADPLRVIEAIARLTALGIQIVIDDFGTGYASLAYLNRLPLTRIKIDKSFVTEMNNNGNDLTIVRSIIGLGHNLGLNVVAEGVENRATWDALKALGCDSAQGYCLAKPMPSNEVAHWIAQSSWMHKTAI